MLSSASRILESLPQSAEILIIRLRSLGDVVMLTPALTALHAWRPDLQLCVLVEPPFAAVLEGNPAIAEVLLHRDFFTTARLLRRRRFSVTFNQHGGPTSAFFTAAAGSPARVCWSHCQFGFLYNLRIPDVGALDARKHFHTVEHRLTQFYWAGLPPSSIPPAQVFPQPDALASVEQLLAASGIVPRAPFAVLHPGAAYFTKRWALEHFAAAAQWLHAQHGLNPVVVLGPGDRELVPAVRRLFAPPAVVFDSLSLRELIALISRARLVLGNDSGPAHLATAAGRPVAVIFGSSDSVTWRPWQVPHRVVQNEFSCNPCRGDRCYAFPEPRCILSVTLEQVRDACNALLAETRNVVQLSAPA
ncbi:MAG: glycosyltransferase family 9 protein [Acidobacteria bacterium]|nr:glycosyltransferase family 9 protein [Acidobacteriota bacterium]MBI3664514.1 glycosyltransferase family 9 protein [Acidobacteriota bacterium]